MSEQSKASNDVNLPYDAHGKLNWDVLGKMLTAKLLGEVVCASHVDKKHCDRKLDEGFKPDTDWEFCYEKDEVTVLRKKTYRTCFMGRGVINTPVRVVAEFIKDVQSTFIWDNFLVDARYEKVISESEDATDFIGYQYFELNQHCGLLKLKRDMLYYARCAYIEDGKYVQVGMSIEDSDFPPHSGVPRVTMHMGSGFLLEPYRKDPNRTLLSYNAHIDTKGVPSFINSQVLKEHPMITSKIRTHLEGRINNESTPLSSSIPSLPHSPYHTQQSSRYYEDPLQTGYFVKET